MYEMTRHREADGNAVRVTLVPVGYAMEQEVPVEISEIHGAPRTVLLSGTLTGIVRVPQ
jgi:hypothetical protein